MATAPVGRPQEVKKDEWREVKAPEQFKWTRTGESMTGVLLSIEPTVVKGKANVEYTFELVESKNLITMLETADLKKKVRPSMMGYKLRIRYETDQRFEGQSADQSAMKIFKVEQGAKVYDLPTL